MIYVDSEKVLVLSILYCHLQNVGKKILEKGFGGAVFMDLSKAFDTLNYELLIEKLIDYDS